MIKVYRFCECDLVVTNKSIEDTIGWYNKEYMDADETDVEEIDINKTKITVEDDDGESRVTVGDYISDIDKKHMPMIFASTEY